MSLRYRAITFVTGDTVWCSASSQLVAQLAFSLARYRSRAKIRKWITDREAIRDSRAVKNISRISRATRLISNDPDLAGMLFENSSLDRKFASGRKFAGAEVAEEPAADVTQKVSREIRIGYRDFVLSIRIHKKYSICIEESLLTRNSYGYFSSA